MLSRRASTRSESGTWSLHNWIKIGVVKGRCLSVIRERNTSATQGGTLNFCDVASHIKLAKPWGMWKSRLVSSLQALR